MFVGRPGGRMERATGEDEERAVGLMLARRDTPGRLQTGVTGRGAPARSWSWQRERRREVVMVLRLGSGAGVLARRRSRHPLQGWGQPRLEKQREVSAV